MTGRSMPSAGTTTRVAHSRPDGCFDGAGLGAGVTPGASEPDGDGDAEGGADGSWSEGRSTISGVGSTVVPAVVGSGYVSSPAVMSTTPRAVSSAGRIRDVTVCRIGGIARES